jgi:hypothetical protein
MQKRKKRSLKRGFKQKDEATSLRGVELEKKASLEINGTEEITLKLHELICVLRFGCQL